jgi:MinD-like ATPase involved in chromosome partitioning or flagellar assembly
VENGPIVVLFMGSGKGGAGVSTVTANVAWLTSQRMPPGEDITVIDAGYGVNATLSKLLGVGFTDGGTCVSSGLYEYILDVKGATQIQPVPREKLKVIGPGCLSIDAINWGLPELVSVLGRNPDIVVKYLQDRFTRIFTSVNSRIIIIDLPSSTLRPLAWSLISMADIVFIVGEWGDVHVHEVNDALSLVEGVAKIVKRRIATYVIVNKALPIADSDMRRLISHTYDGLVTLPYSRIVHALTSLRRDLAVRYSGDPQARREFEYRYWVDNIRKLSDIILELAKKRWA